MALAQRLLPIRGDDPGFPVAAEPIVFDLQVHDGADPGEGVGKDQSAIAEAGVRGCLDRRQEASEPRLRRMPAFCLRCEKISRS
jgi:hypothetical protein